jgi:uncharacterized DUF497 family protein
MPIDAELELQSLACGACGTYARGVPFTKVRYVFDPAKDAVNRAKHGVSLALAEVLFAASHVRVIDDRFDYGEVREIAFGLIEGRLFVCVYADRKSERRVISLRKANRREVRRYGQEKIE